MDLTPTWTLSVDFSKKLKHLRNFLMVFTSSLKFLSSSFRFFIFCTSLRVFFNCFLLWAHLGCCSVSFRVFTKNILHTFSCLGIIFENWHKNISQSFSKWKSTLKGKFVRPNNASTEHQVISLDDVNATACNSCFSFLHEKFFSAHKLQRWRHKLTTPETFY